MEQDIKEATGRRETFYLIPKRGGFQIRRLIVEGKEVLEDKPFSDPDGWDQVMSIIEHEMSRKFA